MPLFFYNQPESQRWFTEKDGDVGVRGLGRCYVVWLCPLGTYISLVQFQGLLAAE